MYTSQIIVDDFLLNPLEIRERALNLDYREPKTQKNYPGINSRQRLDYPGLDNLVSELTGEQVVGSTAENAHGHCRVSLNGDDNRRKLQIHIDFGLVWAGLLYLTLPESCQGGTEFYRHLESASDRAPIYPDELKAAGVQNYAEAGLSIIKKDSNDPLKWEHISTVPMRFNRLVLLRPWFYHTAGPSFGDRIENGRLVQLFFFEGVS
jgi:hypothetical protein